MKHILFILLFPAFLSGQNLINIIAGETIGDQTFCYISASDGKAYIADPTDETKQAAGLVQIGVSAADTTQIIFDGIQRWKPGGIVPGRPHYLAASGGITATLPASKFQQVAYGIDDTTLVLSFKPRQSRILEATATLNFPSISSKGDSDLTMTVTGASIGDCVALGAPNISNFLFHAFVSGTNTVTVRAVNNDTVSVNIAADSFSIKIIK